MKPIASFHALLFALLLSGSTNAEEHRLLLAKPDNFQFAVFHVAEQAGCFKERELSFEHVVPAYRRGIIQATLDEQAQIALLPAPSLLAVLVEQGNWVVVANLLRNESVNLVLRQAVAEARGIKASLPLAERVEKVRGLRLGVAPGPVGRLHRLLAHFGKEPEFVETVIVPGKQQNAALSGERVDGLLCHTPYLERATMTGEAVIVVNLVAGEVPELAQKQIHSLAVTGHLARSRPKLVRRLVEGLECGSTILRQHPERAQKALLMAAPKRSAAEIAMFVHLYREAFPESLAVSAEGVRAMRKRSPSSHPVPELSGVKLEAHVDSSFITNTGFESWNDRRPTARLDDSETGGTDTEEVGLGDRGADHTSEDQPWRRWLMAAGVLGGLGALQLWGRKTF